MVKKRSLKRIKSGAENESQDQPQAPPSTRLSDEPVPKKSKWINRTRVLVLATRGISHQDRHLLNDLRTMLPHSRDENKIERGENFLEVNEMCEMKNCDKCILLESRSKKDLYMWISNVPTGPSVKFLVESVFTMGELKLTGNCLKGSRPLLSFEESFDTSPQLVLLKEMLTQIFGTPAYHPKCQPFSDRVVTFSILDNRIWFRNFQILTEDGALAEIGPRFVLNPIKIFDDSFGGETLWENPKYVTPAKYRRQVKLSACNKYVDRIQQKENFYATVPKISYTAKPNDDLFEGNPLEKAKEISEKVKTLKGLNQHLANSKKTNLSKKKKPLKNVPVKKAHTKPSFEVEVNTELNTHKRKKLQKSISQNGFTVMN